MGIAQRPDAGVTIPIEPVHQRGKPPRWGAPAGVLAIGALVIVAIGARLTTTPSPSPSTAAGRTPAAPTDGAAASVPGATPTTTPTSPLPTPIAIDESQARTPSGSVDYSAANPDAAEIAGQTAGQAIVGNLDTGATSIIAPPNGYASVETVAALSDRSMVGTLQPAGFNSLTNAVFIVDRTTNKLRVVRPRKGFEGFTIRGIAGDVAYGEMEHRVTCCTAGAWRLDGSRGITIDLATGAITDVTPSTLRAPHVAVTVPGADSGRLVLSAETVPDPELGTEGPVFLGAAVVDLGSATTTMLDVGTNVAGVDLISGDTVLGRYLDRAQAFTAPIDSTAFGEVPLEDGYGISTCGGVVRVVSAFACVEGVSYFPSHAFLYNADTGTRIDIPFVVISGQELYLDAIEPDGLVLGTVRRTGTLVNLLVFDATTYATYDLDTSRLVERGPFLMAGRWVVTSDGFDAWQLP